MRPPLRIRAYDATELLETLAAKLDLMWHIQGKPTSSIKVELPRMGMSKLRWAIEATIEENCKTEHNYCRSINVIVNDIECIDIYKNRVIVEGYFDKENKAIDEKEFIKKCIIDFELGESVGCLR